MSEQIGMDLGIQIEEEKEELKLPEGIRVRKLTPRECYRLMGFQDKDFDAAEKVNSNTQLYKQAGNSICVNVLEAIFGQMFEGKEDHWKRWLKDRCYK